MFVVPYVMRELQYNFFLYPTAIITGIIIPNILHYNGFYIGDSGVDYYAEVHTTKLNSVIHTIGMPFTIYGMLLWIPVIFNLNCKSYIAIQRFLYISYMTHYVLIDWRIGLNTAIIYYIPVYYSNKLYLSEFNEECNETLQRSLDKKRAIFLSINNQIHRRQTFHIRDKQYIHNSIRFYLFTYGFLMSFYVLLFQEVIGHWLSGDPTSRLEAIPNAILYAMYFSVSHFYQ